MKRAAGIFLVLCCLGVSLCGCQRRAGTYRPALSPAIAVLEKECRAASAVPAEPEIGAREYFSRLFGKEIS